MDLNTATFALLLIFGTLTIVASLIIYGWSITRIAVEGGKVAAGKFGMPDLAVAGVLICYFFFMAYVGFHRAPKPVHKADIIVNVVFFAFVIAGLGGFLIYRGINLAEVFGFRRVRPDKALGLAFVYLLAALPLIFFVSALWQGYMGAKAEPQELVKFFLESTKNLNYKAMIGIGLMGTLFAPFCEEFLFRGYFYGVLKRYFGITAGVLLNSALFAAIHLNETSLPALFLLAVCFTLVYERTGSLLVNMCMHGLFNFMNFCFLIYAARHSLL